MKQTQSDRPARDGALSVTMCILDPAEGSRIAEELARHNLRPLRIMRSMVAFENSKQRIAGQKIKYRFRDEAEASRARRLLAADHTRELPRRDWMEARRQPGKIGDLLAAFIRDKFADELADGTMSRINFRRYKGLYQAFYQHRQQLPPELRNIPATRQRRD